jgi:hypothetical protein
VYVTIQNITPDHTTASGSHTRNASDTKTPSPPPLSQPRNRTCFNPPEESTSSGPGSFPPSGSAPPLNADTYPLIKCVLELIEADKPGKGYAKLEGALTEAGLVLSSHLVMLPEDVLCVIGDMGKGRARVLRNYAKRSVLPLLGLQGNYDDPEIPSPDKGDGHAIIEVEDSAREDDLWQLEDEDEESDEDEDEDEETEIEDGPK